MGMWILNTIPLTLLAVIVISAAIFASLVGLLLARRFLDPSALMRHNDVAGIIYTGVGVIYGVLLPFVVADVWGEFRVAQGEIAAEALALEGLIIDAAQFSDIMEADIRRAVRDYASSVIDDEWATMAWGNESEESRQKVKTIELILRQAEVNTPREQEAFAQMLRQMDQIAEHRDSRLVQSRLHLPGVMWGLILFGGFIVITYTYLYGVESLRSQMLMTAALATVIATVVIVILALDYPFSGNLRPEPDYFERVLLVSEAT